tara:strand:+ start:48 stop:221 length:174 start_codon:yes stop_codon:yes gene_type:complete
MEDTEAVEVCRCGTNDSLMVTSMSDIYQIDGRYMWIVSCLGCGEEHLGSKSRIAKQK